MNKLAIVGAGGHAGVLVDIASDTGWSQIDLYDDAYGKSDKELPESVVGDTASLMNKLAEYDGVIVAIGTNAIREKVQRKLEAAGATMVNIIHPSVIISKTATMGRGCALLAGCFLINNAKIGDGVIINTATSVDHDVEVGDFSHLSAGVYTGGGSVIGRRSFIGIGSCTRHMSVIGDDVTVGAGSVVVKNVEDGVTVIGNPAKPLQR